jgi:hypothetical protein
MRLCGVPKEILLFRYAIMKEFKCLTSRSYLPSFRDILSQNIWHRYMRKTCIQTRTLRTWSVTEKLQRRAEFTFEQRTQRVASRSFTKFETLDSYVVSRCESSVESLRHVTALYSVQSNYYSISRHNLQMLHMESDASFYYPTK